MVGSNGGTKAMTEKQAWAVIANSSSSCLFLCNGISQLHQEGRITFFQARRMWRKIEALRNSIREKYNREDWEITCVWPARSPERIKFAKLAARGHAADYKYPQALADELAAENWRF